MGINAPGKARRITAALVAALALGLLVAPSGEAREWGTFVLIADYDLDAFHITCLDKFHPDTGVYIHTRCCQEWTDSQGQDRILCWTFYRGVSAPDGTRPVLGDVSGPSVAVGVEVSIGQKTGASVRENLI